MRYALLPGLLLLTTMVRGAEPNPLDTDVFAGRFAGDALVAEFHASNGGYTGMLTRNRQTYSVSATRNGATLTGKFTANGSDFSFTASLSGDQLVFSTGTKTYSLTRQERNPLDTEAASGTPAAQATLPADYSVANTSSYGQAISTHKPAMASMQAALASAVRDLKSCFDSPAKLLTAYEDTRDRSVCGATFTATRQGQRYNGWISCKLTQQSTAIVIVYCRADTPAAESAKLFAPGKTQGNYQPAIQLREYRFPDGTGSVGLAEGWTTDAASIMQPVTIKGPNQQEIVLGSSLSIVTPDSMAVRTQMQLIEQARQMGMPPPQLPPMLVASFSDPMEAIATLSPQISRLAWEKAGIRVQIDHLKEVQKITPTLPNAQAAVVTYGMTVAKPGEPEGHYQVVDRVECTPIGAEAWMYMSYAARSPDATFQQDLPVMLTIAGSLQENPAAIQQKTRENIDEMNRRFAAQQKAHRELVQAFDDYNRSWERNQNTQARSADDFSEVMRGYRTVEDTTTGEKTSVDLGHVDQIVDRLNEADPGRYRQIPLRDELDPIPGR